MYAFAIWDGRDQKLVMIRDRMGIKPLYYYRTPDGVLFGSEQKAILAHPLAKRVVDADGLREAFSYAFTPGHAIWADMRQVEPGTIVTVDVTGVRERAYWRLETRPHTDDAGTSVGRVRELLDDIVRRQLVADVPRCLLLSGGLDSGALTALAAAHLGAGQVRTFAVDFMGQAENFRPDDLRDTPDTPFIQDVVRHVGTQHADIVLDPRTLADPGVRRAVALARDLPVGTGDMDLSLYLLFKAIRGKSTVALSGEAADEIFGGYRHMHIPPDPGRTRVPVDRRQRRPLRQGLHRARPAPADAAGSRRLPAGRVRHRHRRGRASRRRRRLRAPHADHDSSARDPVHEIPARPQGPHEHGGRARGPGCRTATTGSSNTSTTPPGR
ncbi:hypothetical protein GCM10020001_111990 [Nonomuraea salmonea]